MLWLVIFGETFNRLHAIPHPEGIPYLAYPGARGSWPSPACSSPSSTASRSSGNATLGSSTKLLATPDAALALIIGKAFAAGIRWPRPRWCVVLVLSAFLGVSLSLNPLNLLGAFAVVMLGSAFFSCLSMTIAGVLEAGPPDGLRSDHHHAPVLRLNALYPVNIMPDWLK